MGWCVMANKIKVNSIEHEKQYEISREKCALALIKLANLIADNEADVLSGSITIQTIGGKVKLLSDIVLKEKK
jgi:hypothetical protein